MDESFANAIRGSPRRKLRALQENLTPTDTPYVLREINKPKDKSTSLLSSPTKDIARDFGKNISVLSVPDITIGNFSTLNVSTDSTEDSVLQARSRNIRAKFRQRTINNNNNVDDTNDEMLFSAPDSMASRSNKTYDELGITLGDPFDDSLDVSMAKEDIKKTRKRKGAKGGLLEVSSVSIAGQVQNIRVRTDLIDRRDNVSGLLTSISEGLENTEDSISIDEDLQNVVKSRIGRSRRSVHLNIDPIVSEVVSDVSNKKRVDLKQTGSEDKLIDASRIDIETLSTGSEEPSPQKVDMSLIVGKRRLEVSLENIIPDVFSKKLKTSVGIVSNISVLDASRLSDISNITIDNSLSKSSSYKAGNVFSQKRKSVSFALDDVISGMRKTHKTTQEINSNKNPNKETLDLPESYGEDEGSFNDPSTGSTEIEIGKVSLKTARSAESPERSSLKIFTESASVDMPGKSHVEKNSFIETAAVDITNESFAETYNGSFAENLRNSYEDTLQKSSAVIPSKSSAVTPSKSSTESPSKSSPATSSKSSAETPSKSSAETPRKSSVETPRKSSVETPRKSSVETLSKSSAETPSKSSVGTPRKFAAEIPNESSAETPKKSTPRKYKNARKSLETLGTSSAKRTRKSFAESPIKSSVETRIGSHHLSASENLINRVPYSDATDSSIILPDKNIQVSPDNVDFEREKPINDMNSKGIATSSPEISISSPRKRISNAEMPTGKSGSSPVQRRLSPRKLTQLPSSESIDTSPETLNEASNSPKTQISPKMFTKLPSSENLNTSSEIEESLSPEDRRVSPEKSLKEQISSPGALSQKEEISPRKSFGGSDSALKKRGGLRKLDKESVTETHIISPEKLTEESNSNRQRFSPKKLIKESKQHQRVGSRQSGSPAKRRTSPRKSVEPSVSALENQRISPRKLTEESEQNSSVDSGKVSGISSSPAIQGVSPREMAEISVRSLKKQRISPRKLTEESSLEKRGIDRETLTEESDSKNQVSPENLTEESDSENQVSPENLTEESDSENQVSPENLTEEVSSVTRRSNSRKSPRILNSLQKQRIGPTKLTEESSLEKRGINRSLQKQRISPTKLTEESSLEKRGINRSLQKQRISPTKLTEESSLEKRGINRSLQKQRISPTKLTEESRLEKRGINRSLQKQRISPTKLTEESSLEKRGINRETLTEESDSENQVGPENLTEESDSENQESPENSTEDVSSVTRRSNPRKSPKILNSLQKQRIGPTKLTEESSLEKRGINRSLQKQRISPTKLTEELSLEKRGINRETLTEESDSENQVGHENLTEESDSENQESPENSTEDVSSVTRRSNPRKSPKILNSLQKQRIGPTKLTEESSLEKRGINRETLTEESDSENQVGHENLTEESDSENQESPENSTEDVSSVTRRSNPRKSPKILNSLQKQRIGPTKLTEESSLEKRGINRETLTEESDSENQVGPENLTEEISISSPRKRISNAEMPTGESGSSPVQRRLGPRKSTLISSSPDNQKISPRRNIRESTSKLEHLAERPNIEESEKQVSAEKSPGKSFSLQQLRKSPRNHPAGSVRNSLSKSPEKLASSPEKIQDKRQGISPEKDNDPKVDKVSRALFETSDLERKRLRSLPRKSSELSVFSDTSSTASDISLQEGLVPALKTNLVSRKRQSVTFELDNIIAGLWKTHENKQVLSQNEDKSTNESLLYDNLTAFKDSIRRESSVENLENLDVPEGINEDEIPSGNLPLENEMEEERPPTEAPSIYRLRNSPQKPQEMSEASPAISRRRSKISEVLVSKFATLNESSGSSKSHDEPDTLISRSPTKQLSSRELESLLKSVSETVQNSIGKSHRDFVTSTLQNFISSNLIKLQSSQPSTEETTELRGHDSSIKVPREFTDGVTDAGQSMEQGQNERVFESHEKPESTPVAFVIKSPSKLSLGSAKKKKSSILQTSLHRESTGGDTDVRQSMDQDQSENIFESHAEPEATPVASINKSPVAFVIKSPSKLSLGSAKKKKSSILQTSLHRESTGGDTDVRQSMDQDQSENVFESHAEPEATPVASINKSRRKLVRSAKKKRSSILQTSLHSKSRRSSPRKSRDQSVSQTPNASKSLSLESNQGENERILISSLSNISVNRNKTRGETSQSKVSPSQSTRKGGEEGVASTSRSTKKGNRDVTQLTLKEFLEKMSKNELPREKEPDHLREMLKKPEILLKMTPTHTTKKPRAKKDSIPKLIKNLPSKMNCAVFQHFLKHKLTKEGAKAVQDMTEIFFENLSSDLAVILASTNEKSINKNHVYLLMKQLKMVDCWEGLYSLMQELLPSDEWKKVVPIRYAFNKVYPSRK